MYAYILFHVFLYVCICIYYVYIHIYIYMYAPFKQSETTPKLMATPRNVSPLLACQKGQKTARSMGLSFDSFWFDLRQDSSLHDASPRGRYASIVC